MNVSRIFIERPIGTALLAAGLFLAGAVAYVFLPVASMPAIELPTIRVSVSRPGADPATMAASVASPLERRLGEIAGVTEMTSSSSLGSTFINIQFDLGRSVDGAGRDVQAALNAAMADIPGDLPQVPTYRKYNPSGSPILILALTSDTMTTSGIYDAADTVIGQRISQVDGVADVTVSGADQPATRIQVDPALVAQMGVSFEDVRALSPLPTISRPSDLSTGRRQTIILQSNRQMTDPEDYKNIVVKNLPNGDIVRVGDVAKVVLATRNRLSSARFDKKPAVLLIIRKKPEANVINTVDGVKALLPQLKHWIPGRHRHLYPVGPHRNHPGLRSRHAVDPGVDHPAGHVGCLHLLEARHADGCSRHHCAAIAGRHMRGDVGRGIFDKQSDADVVCGRCRLRCRRRHRDDRKRLPQHGTRHEAEEAALEGARQIGFTVISISVSLIAAFIPVLFMTGVVGRLLHEFAMTLTFSIVISAIVSLTVTPMICAHFIKSGAGERKYLADRLFRGRP